MCHQRSLYVNYGSLLTIANKVKGSLEWYHCEFTSQKGLCANTRHNNKLRCTLHCSHSKGYQDKDRDKVIISKILTTKVNLLMIIILHAQTWCLVYICMLCTEVKLSNQHTSGKKKLNRVKCPKKKDPN